MAMSASAQEMLDTKVNLNLNNVSLEKSLKEIEKSSQIKFSFNSRAINIDQKVSINASQEALYSVLNRLFKPLDIQYVQVSNKIILRNETKSEVLSSSVEGQRLISDIQVKGQ